MIYFFYSWTRHLSVHARPLDLPHVQEVLSFLYSNLLLTRLLEHTVEDKLPVVQFQFVYIIAITKQGQTVNKQCRCTELQMPKETESRDSKETKKLLDFKRFLISKWEVKTLTVTDIRKKCFIHNKHSFFYRIIFADLYFKLRGFKNSFHDEHTDIVIDIDSGNFLNHYCTRFYVRSSNSD